MIVKTATQKKKADISNVNLVIIAVASTFFPRLLMLFKVPSIINFAHFIVVPFVFVVVLLTTRSKDPHQLKITKQILFALFILLTIEVASAFLNEAGVINVILHFLMFNEPVMLLLAIISIPMSAAKIHRFRKYILGFGFFNLILALIQRFVLRWDIRGRSLCSDLDGVDTITGVFTCQGAGVIVSASVSLALVIYFFVAEKQIPRWLRVLSVIGCFLQIILADAKQVLIVGGVAFGLMSLTNLKDIKKTILILIATFIGFQIFWWAIFNLEFLGAFAGWIRPDLYGPDGEATRFKLFGINTILEHMDSLLKWLFGLGPGHTVDRLGRDMLRIYEGLLSPLGSTTSTVASEVWSKAEDSWLAGGSTMFSPFFGWAAIWGDLGLLGLVAHFYLYWMIWHYLCLDDMSKFQLLCVFVVGWIQVGLQEPGYMVYVAALLGIRWHQITYKVL